MGQFARLLGILLALLVARAAPVSGHGGGILQVANAETGPYLTSVWTSPPAARSGQPLHVTVAVADADSGEPVLDARVMVQLRLRDSDATVSAAEATRAQSTNRLFYEADFDRLPAGIYQVMVAVAGEAGAGEVAFMLEVEPSSASRWLTWGLSAVALAASLFLWRNWQRRSARLN